MQDLAKDSNPPFRGLLLNSETPEEIEAKAEKLLADAKAIREKQSQVLQAAQVKEKEDDLKLLALHKEDLKQIDEDLKYPGLSLAEVNLTNKKRFQVLHDISEIERKYGLVENVIDLVSEPVKGPKITAWPTISKIVGLLIICWAIVFGSGEWILEAYPNAAVYNVISFQKVLFAFSVFFAGIAASVVAQYVFFPGIGKYMNPFNREQLDFFNDFKKLSEWQRTAISLALFFILFLGFVLTVSGKLD